MNEITINNLDEIKEDEILAISKKGTWRIEILDKKDFLDSMNYLDKEECTVSIAQKTYANFDWDYIFENMSEEQYEDWESDFRFDLKIEDWEVLNKAKEIINTAIQKNPTYWESKNIVYKCEEMQKAGDQQ